MLDKGFNIAKNSEHDGYRKGLVSMVYKFSDKKKSGGAIKDQIESNKELAEELSKTINRNFTKQKLYSSFLDNICSPGLADMQLTKRFNKLICFLLCISDILRKYAWIIYLKGITITNVFEEDFVIRKVKNTVPWHMLLMIVMVKKLLEHFMKKINQRMFRVKIEIKRKRDKFYFKWKGYDSSFNSWIDKNDIIKGVNIF